MKGKILLLVGLGVGYVLGTRAGREQYDKISSQANKLWNDPRVQKQVKTAEDFVKDKAPEVADFVTDNAKKVAGQVSGKGSNSKSSNSSTSSTGSTGSTSPSI